jgi:SAM-dependent methyltransferase
MSRLTEWMDHKLYPQYGESWDAVLFRDYLLKSLPKEATVLDYGAGRGAHSFMNLKGLAKHVVGVDPDEAVMGNPQLDEAHVLELPQGRIPCDDDRFDMVFSCNVLEHVAEPQDVFREISRVLKPGGIFVAKTPSKWHYSSTIARLTPHRFHVLVNETHGTEEHDTFPTLYRCNTPQDVRRIARDSGLELVDVQMTEGRPEYLRRAAPLYLAGYLFERLVNVHDVLSPLRAVLIFTLRKPAAG